MDVFDFDYAELKKSLEDGVASDIDGVVDRIANSGLIEEYGIAIDDRCFDDAESLLYLMGECIAEGDMDTAMVYFERLDGKPKNLLRVFLHGYRCGNGGKF
jgi:hypothetical protein